jgi:hypothetical protein
VLVQGDLLQLLIAYLQFGWLYAKRAVITFQIMWYQSEIQYIDKRIAKLECEMVEPDGA